MSRSSPLIQTGFGWQEKQLSKVVVWVCWCDDVSAALASVLPQGDTFVERIFRSISSLSYDLPRADMVVRIIYNLSGKDSASYTSLRTLVRAVVHLSQTKIRMTASLQTLFERLVNLWFQPRIPGFLKGSDLYRCDEIISFFLCDKEAQL